MYETGMMLNPRWIINFPTKRHWRGKSRIQDIRDGLAALVDEVRERNIASIAIPPLGCGNGGLEWSVIRPLIVAAFQSLPDVHVDLYAPLGAPDAHQMPIRTAEPNMTPARALIVKVIERYPQLSYRLTLLEVQKLAYFLQEAGEPLRLKYEPGHFGPYATNLNKVLERIEGHYTLGYGDSQRPDQDLDLVQGVIEKADRMINEHPESAERLERVAELIEGYETPYGMELLSSVHWVALHGDSPARTEESAVEAIHSWNERKGRMFQEQHIATLSANVRETQSTQRIRVGRRQRKRTCWDCEREWKRMVVPLERGGQAKRGSSCGPGGSR